LRYMATSFECTCLTWCPYAIAILVPVPRPQRGWQELLQIQRLGWSAVLRRHGETEHFVPRRVYCLQTSRSG
jgi:hypothetical protein